MKAAEKVVGRNVSLGMEKWSGKRRIVQETEARHMIYVCRRLGTHSPVVLQSCLARLVCTSYTKDLC